jgi:hypothetical protein
MVASSALAALMIVLLLPLFVGAVLVLCLLWTVFGPSPRPRARRRRY